VGWDKERRLAGLKVAKGIQKADERLHEPERLSEKERRRIGERARAQKTESQFEREYSDIGDGSCSGDEQERAHYLPQESQEYEHSFDSVQSRNVQTWASNTTTSGNTNASIIVQPVRRPISKSSRGTKEQAPEVPFADTLNYHFASVSCRISGSNSALASD
jgi:hypothetical protein